MGGLSVLWNGYGVGRSDPIAGIVQTDAASNTNGRETVSCECSLPLSMFLIPCVLSLLRKQCPVEMLALSSEAKSS